MHGNGKKYLPDDVRTGSAADDACFDRLFILEALMSVVCGVAAFFTLPDYPHTKTGSQKWTMDDDMRRLAAARMVADRVTGATGEGTVWGGVKSCLVDVKLYLFVSWSIPVQILPILTQILL